MGVASPEHITETFMAAFNARDEKTLLGLYEEGAVFSFDGAQVANGIAEVTGALKQFLASPFQIRGRQVSCYRSGDVALVRFAWELTQDGKTQQSGVSAEALHRGSDGKWRYAVDDATGGGRGG